MDLREPLKPTQVSPDTVLFKEREFEEAWDRCLGEVHGPEEDRDRNQVDDIDISVPVDVCATVVARTVDRRPESKCDDNQILNIHYSISIYINPT
jgi:hypothetical protein